MEQTRRLALTVLFSGVVFCFFLAAMTISGLTMSLLAHNGLMPLGRGVPNMDLLILILVLFSVCLGTALTAVLSQIPLRPVNRLINALNRLASGDYRTRLQFHGPIGAHPTARELSESFNKLAAELENTELLRSDFVNNFSHEFKTPIVSIAGFAALLKRGNLTEEQRQEYIEAIEEESLRLSAMATNVLNLTRVENQTILSGVRRFNLSEQLRACILLLERKWGGKNLDLDIDFAEYYIEANEELLKQVWINLLDNAVKFSPDYGALKVSVSRREGHLLVAVSNMGEDIPGELQQRIFQKFYQADESHAAEGNGIGLAIVKRVVELHGGEVYVESGGGTTTFTVLLPEKA